MGGMFSLIIMLAGVYILLAARKLKINGEINTGLMRSPNNINKRIKDMEGYKNFMYPKVLILSVITIVLGLWYTLVDGFPALRSNPLVRIVEIIVLLCFLAYTIYYIKQIRKAEEMFTKDQH